MLNAILSSCTTTLQSHLTVLSQCAAASLAYSNEATHVLCALDFTKTSDSVAVACIPCACSCLLLAFDHAFAASSCNPYSWPSTLVCRLRISLVAFPYSFQHTWRDAANVQCKGTVYKKGSGSKTMPHQI
jgi:hypothetical protein